MDKHILKISILTMLIGVGSENIYAQTTVNVENLDTMAPSYNLAGQRVNASYKGIVIKNGRKYMQQ